MSKICLTSYYQANRLWKAHVLPPKMLWKPTDLMTLQWSGLVRWWTYENQCLWTLQGLATKCFKSDQINFLMNGCYVLVSTNAWEAGDQNLHVSLPVLSTDLFYIGWNLFTAWRPNLRELGGGGGGGAGGAELNIHKSKIKYQAANYKLFSFLKLQLLKMIYFSFVIVH